MADNVQITEGSGKAVSTEEVTTLNGNAVSAQHLQRIAAALRTGDGIAIDLPGDSANGLDVDVTRLPALPTGDNNIGNVDIVTVPADPFGATADAAVSAGATGSISAKLRSISRDLIANIVLAAGSARIGKVTIRNTADGADIDPLAESTFTGRFAAGGALGDGASKPTTAPVGAWLIGYNGATGDLVRVQNVRKDLSAVSISSIATVWTPASGKKIRLMGGSISVSAAASVLFEDNSAGAGNFVWRTPKLIADTPYNFDLGNGKLGATADNVLKATASASATITGTLYGVEE